MDEELVTAIAERAHWEHSGAAARYCPAPQRWSAMIRRSGAPARTHQRFHIAILTPAGTPAYTHARGIAADAVRLAERTVNGLNTAP